MNGLKAAREQCKMTIQEVADKLGVSKQIVSAWEKGKKVIPDARKKQLSELFGIPESRLGEISEEEVKELEHIASGTIVEVDKTNDEAFRERMMLYTSKAYQASVYAKISQEKDEQKAIEKKIHKHFECSDASPIKNQLSHIERANKLYGSFDNVVELLYKSDAKERSLYFGRIAEFLYAMELELGGEIDKKLLGSEMSGAPTKKGVDRARKTFANSMEASRTASQEAIENASEIMGKIIESQIKAKGLSKDANPIDVLVDYALDHDILIDPENDIKRVD